MKKFISIMLLLAMILALSACSTKSLTMQEVYDAFRQEEILASHDSMAIKVKDDAGEYYNYINKDIYYENGGAWSTYITDKNSYILQDGVCNFIVYIGEDGLLDMTVYRAERYEYILGAIISLEESVQSVDKINDTITVTSTLEKDAMQALDETMVACETEYVLEAKTLSPISVQSHYEYDGGMASDVFVEFEYDAPMPEDVLSFVELEQQTENLRTVTMVFNPSTEKENSVAVQAPKGMPLGLVTASNRPDEYKVYDDAACTLPHVAGDNDSDVTIYIKWLA